MTGAVRSIWARLSAREQWALRLASCALGGLLIWSVGLAPALKTVSSAPAALQALDTQASAMQQMASQAAGLKQRAAPARAADAARLLEAAVQQRLGPGASLSSNGDRATVTIQAAQPDALTQWLAQARETAGAVAEQATLRRNATGWEGKVVLRLPAAP